MKSVTADPYLPGHGDLRYAVSRYDLDLTYKPAGNVLHARAVLDVRLKETTAQIALDLHGLRVLRVSIAGATLARWTHRESRLTLTFGAKVPAGSTLVVSVDYKGSPRTMPGPDGRAGWEELDDGVIVAAQPHGAPTWFPCNDRAADKASYRFTVTTEAAYTVVANGVLTSRKQTGRHQVWTYLLDAPVSPYLAALQIGRYVVSELPGPVRSRLVYPARLRTEVTAAFADQPRMIDFFVERFGPYPYAVYDVVVTDDPLEIPLESATLSTFGSNHATRAWESQRLIAHELAHQWFGNCVTARQWRDIWLHEGFACYAEWLWSQEVGVASTQEQARRHYDGIAGKAQNLLLADPGPKGMFDDRVYKRGALALHAVRAAIGDEAFFEVLRTYVADHRHSVVSTGDFEAAVRIVVGPGEGERVCAEVLDPWLRTRPLPPLPSLTPSVPVAAVAPVAPAALVDPAALADPAVPAAWWVSRDRH